MLGSADRQVVARDPDLAALGVLLDTDLLDALLAERLGRPCEVTPGRLRYKPGTSCVLSLGLRVGDDPVTVPCLARAYAPRAAAKFTKARGAVADDQVLLADPSSLLLVTTLAGDRRLAAMAPMSDPRRRLALLERLLGPRPELREARIATLRHNPERRWVGVMDLPHGSTERLVLRAYRPSSAAAHLRAYAHLDGVAVTSPLVGRSRRHGMLAVGWAAGTALEPDGPHEQFRTAGRALATLHCAPPPRLRLSGPDQQAAHVLEAAEQVAGLLPAERARVRGLAAGLAAALRAAPPGAVLLHGDFSHDQAVVGDRGEVTLVDLDAAALGDPAQDLGSAWAALLATTTPDAAATRFDALLDGYAEVASPPSPETLATHRDGQLLRRAVEGFRTRDAGWDDRARAVLALLESSVRSVDGGP